MSDRPGVSQPRPKSFASAWSQMWVRAVVLVGIWIGLAIFFYTIGADHLRQGHDALLIVAWGIVGIAFGAFWIAIERALSSWMDRRGTPNRRLIAVGLYLVFIITMGLALAVLSSGTDPYDWVVMAYLAFLLVLGFSRSRLTAPLKDAPPASPAS